MLYLFSNPNSHINKDNAALHKVEDILSRRGVAFCSFICTTPGDAKTHMDSIIERGGGDVIVIGGDGTLCNIMNSISDFNKVRIGLIAAGTGNDFAKTLKISRNLEETVADILDGTHQRIDLIKVGDKYCTNIVATGLDIEVLKRYYKVKFFKGKAQYFIALIKTLIGFSSYHVRITMEGREPFETDAMLVAVGNGQYFGGGMMATPQADPRDGKMAFTIVHRMPGITIARNLIHFLKGRHHKVKYIENFSTSEPIKIEVLEEGATQINIDGEILEHKFECEILPSAVTLLNSQR